MKNKLTKFLYPSPNTVMDFRQWQILLGGIFLIWFGLLAICFNIYRGKPLEALWMCYIAMILIGIGALRQNGFLIASQINLISMPLIFWNIDFLFSIITDSSLWGITDYWFKDLLPLARFISLEHFFLAPLALYLLYLIKFSRKDHWKLSWLTLSMMFIITILFTEATENTNCAFKSCATLLPDHLYPFTYLVFLYIASLAISLILNKTSFFIEK